jgi:uncharacterized protein (TIGR01244 family)
LTQQTTRQMPVLRTPRPGLCTCGQPGPGAWVPLARAGVSTVVNLVPDDEMPDRVEADEVRAAGLVYVHIPVRDANDLTPNAARRLQDVLLNSPVSVLVHCATGNRAGALLALGDAWFGSRDIENALALGRYAGMQSLEPTVRVLLAQSARH